MKPAHAAQQTHREQRTLRQLLAQPGTAATVLADQLRRIPRDRTTALRAGVVLAACIVGWAGVFVFGRPYDFFDMKIYHGAIVWWSHGGELYDYIAPNTTLGFTYPPFAALMMLPMVIFATPVAGWLNVIISLASLAFALAVLLAPMADRLGQPRWLAVAVGVPLFTAIEPVRETLGFGQVNLMLFAMVIADLYAVRRGWRWAGVGVGLATAIKLTPGLFILYFVASRQWRRAATAAGTTAAVTIAAHLIVPHESVTFWGSMIWQTGRVGEADMTPNQSLAGLMARLYDSSSAPGLLWIAFALVVLAVGLNRANTAHAERDELTAYTLVGLTSNVVSPISWTHHLVWVVPAVIGLSDQALRRRVASRGLQARGRNTPGLREPIWFPRFTGARHAAAALAVYILFLLAPIWWYEHSWPAVSHYADGIIGMLAENSLAIALIVLVAALPWRPGAEPATGLVLTRATATARPAPPAAPSFDHQR